MPLCIDQLGVDFLSFSGHKIYAPKGIGGWYMRPEVPFQPLLFGGHQERGRRSGTENVPGIVALGKACDIAQQDMPQELTRQARLQLKTTLGRQEKHAPTIAGTVERCDDFWLLTRADDDWRSSTIGRYSRLGYRGSLV